jgi:hypothetical protein
LSSQLRNMKAYLSSYAVNKPAIADTAYIVAIM